MNKVSLAVESYQPILDSLQDHFRDRLKCVVLFGSQARGEARPDSDHDLFVVIEDLPRDPLQRNRSVRMTLLPVLDRLPGPISFIAKTPGEVAANLTPLLLDVFVDGICIYGRSYYEPLHRRAVDAVQQAGLHRKRITGTWTWRFPKIQTVDWEISWEGYRESSR